MQKRSARIDGEPELKVLIGAVLAAKKFIIIGLVAIGSFVKRFITGNKQPPPA